MTIDEYKKQMKGVCDYIRKLEGRIQALENEINELKKKGQKPIRELTDEDKAQIEKVLCNDDYNNDDSMGLVKWSRNICYCEYNPCDNTPSEKQLEFAKKLLSNKSQYEGIDRFLLGKAMDVVKRWDMSKVQMILVKGQIRPKPTPQPRPTLYTNVQPQIPHTS